MAAFDDMIHRARGDLLAKLPKGAEVFCSAGCAGGWYFDWVEETYGSVRRHIGVELHSPRPPALPANVEWIANSVADMIEVATASVDIMFSGQNVEHLYLDDMKGFFREAARTVKPGGLLVMDSPNRRVTEGRYIQPEHVLELTVEEAVAVTVASGFEIVELAGIWRCIEEEGQVHEIFDIDDAETVRRRLESAGTHPTESFIWWLIARRTGTDPGGADALVDELFRTKFPAFVRTRFDHSIGTPLDVAGTETTVQLGPIEVGYALYGPYVPLVPGQYSVTFDYRILAEGGELTFEVIEGVGGATLASETVPAVEETPWQRRRLFIDVGAYTPAVETRVHSANVAALLRFGSRIERIC